MSRIKSLLYSTLIAPYIKYNKEKFNSDYFSKLKSCPDNKKAFYYRDCFSPSNTLDVGCGIGNLVWGFLNSGVIAEGIDISKEKKINFTREKTKFLYLGRIHPIKGLDLLIKTWSRIELENKNCTLEICGYYEDISYYKFLQDLIKKFGLKNISFTDKVSGLKKKEKYLSNDVFIIPSKSENFGLVIAEAMSYGLPVIVSEETPWHVVKKNNYGWVVSLNQDDIYSAISAANSLNKNDLKNMGQLGRIYIKDYFSWNVLSKDYLAFYDWVRNGGSTPSFMDIF